MDSSDGFIDRGWMTREGANREAKSIAFVNRRERFHFGWNAVFQGMRTRFAANAGLRPIGERDGLGEQL